MNRWLGVWTLVGLLVGATSTADAQVATGALRLHLETGALGFSHATRTDAGSDNSLTTVSVGPYNTGIGFGLGYAVNETVVVGGNVMLQIVNLSDEGDSLTATVFALAPYVEVLLGEGTARPFLGAQIPFQYLKAEDNTLTAIGVQGLIGVHIFVAESASLDLSLRPLVNWQSDEDDRSTRTLGVLGMIGVSAWSS